ncbi:MAG TPA: NADH-quinone oxidoreductase subunit NuoK [Methanomassiliicoccales archaeon]|jgi:NADH-quinone oxidoreductase subunit K|nr:NADH-quinone oxidoreductase subunit NuoK [Euryarchaeota archaeon]HOE52238.1 NADH-quinone oxidoreductase subunit NuoK [Methanomassiliicoccales archaeon]HOO03553.1 NADH-quinone oxidoreductase subunit NuoK [Methanomassiliicoccales archaeon]HPD08280.1 NADH-quinone oxidoreductase subunit NuoK [Methanomassiliicoccales archaeon]HQM66682.1 NADH-quinone oxidoreductase subunit NuoK [Methanomassiliicoccales archaeon]
MIPLEFVLIVSSALFAIGAAGVILKKNAIQVLMAIELMLNAANINLVAFSTYFGDAKGQGFALISIGIAAAEVTIGLAILLNLNKLRKTVDVDDINLLRW